MTSPSRSKTRRVLVLTLLVVAMLAAGGGVAYFSLIRWREADAAEARETGFALFDEGKFAEALPHLSKAVARDRKKTDAEAMRRLARARLMVPEPNGAHLVSAVRFYQAAVFADPSDLASRLAILEILARAGRLVEAESTAREILEIDPDSPLAREVLVQTALQRGDASAALAMLTDRIRSHPQDLEAKLRFVETSLATGGKPAELQEQVERWLAEPDADPILRVARIVVMQRTQARSGIAAELDALESATPRSASGALVLSRVLHLAGRPFAGKRALLDGAARFEDAKERLAAEALRVSLLDDDLETAARALALADGAKAGWVTRGRLRIASLKEDLAEIERLLAEGSTIVEDRRYALALKSSLAERPTAEDASAVAAAIEVEPADFVMLAAQARLRAAGGDFAGAVNSLSQAFDASGRAWVRAAARLAPALESSGDRGRAAEVVRVLVEKQPGSPVAQSMMLSLAASAAMRGEDPPVPGLDVSVAATQLSSTARANPEALPLAVVALVGASRADEAAALIAHAIGDERTGGEVLLRVAQACIGIGSASAELRKALPSILEAALVRGADARLVEAIRAQGGSSDSFDSLVAMADTGDAVALRAAASLADARLLPEARALLERVLSQDASIGARLLVLQSQTARRDPELLRKAIDAIDGAAGASDATAAARARLLLLKGGAARAEIDEALESLDELRKRKGDSSETLATMAQLMMAAEPPDARSALRLAAQAAELSPDRVPTQLLAASIAVEAGDPVRAREYLGRIVKLVDEGTANAAVCMLVAAQHGALGDLTDAARLAARGAEAIGRSEAWLEAAARAAVAGDESMRERALRAAVSASDASPVAAARLANLLASTGRLDEARRVMSEFAASRPEAEMLPFRIEFDLAFGDRLAAAAALDAALAKAPDDGELLSVKLIERRASGDLPGALEIARRLVGMSRGTGVAVDLALQACSLPGAEGDAAVALLVAARLPQAEALRELRDMRDGRATASIERARSLAAASPRLWAGWALAMDVARTLGDAEGLAGLATDAARQLPGDEAALRSLAIALLELGRGEAALSTMEQLRVLPGVDPRLVARLTVFATLATKDPEQAKRIALRADAKSDDLDSAMLASAIEARQGDVAKAYARIRDRIADSPAAIQAWVSTSLTMPQKESRQLLELASEHEVRAPYAFASAWAALAIHGGLNAAERAKAVLERFPDEPERRLLAAAVAAEVHLARGDADAFKAARERLAALVPESMRGVLDGRKAPSADPSEQARFVAEIAATEALILVEKGRDPDRALALVEAALSLVDSTAYRITRGRALLAKRDAAQALGIAERLTTAAPMNADAWLLLANARLQTGDRGAAGRAVERGRDAAARTFFVHPSTVRGLESALAAAREETGG